MEKSRLQSHRFYTYPFVCRFLVFLCLFGFCLGNYTQGATGEKSFTSRFALDKPFVLTQLPLNTKAEKQGPRAEGMLSSFYGDGSRLLIVYPDFSTRVLSKGFYSACEPDVSFDGERILFAGKRTASDNWNIYEMSLNDSVSRRITSDIGNCRSPCYQSTLYTIISTKPWYQVTFASDGSGALNEYGSVPETDLYSCKLDGGAMRRLTFNLSSDMDPFIMPDGRLIFSSWRRSNLDHGYLGRIELFGINLDGADFAAFASEKGKLIKRMPCTTTGGLCIFVESQRDPWDGAGTLSCVKLRRPLHSYRRITDESDGLFHSPSPLPNGKILVSKRSVDGTDSHGIYCLDPESGQYDLVFDDPKFHDINAKLVYPRPEPDGRSSVVTEKDPHGRLYCMNVNLSDLKNPDWLKGETNLRLRVVEGMPAGIDIKGNPPIVCRRILGEIPVEKDGSFNIEIPASIPIELQLIGKEGASLKSCGWIWAKNHEPRGCIGCHEDGELTPQNLLVDAATHPSVVLCPPVNKRVAVDFRHDVMPIIEKKCSACHGDGKRKPLLMSVGKRKGNQNNNSNNVYKNLMAGFKLNPHEPCRGKYIYPGKARLSPLAWHLFGHVLARPWDNIKTGKVKKMPPHGAQQLTEKEKQIILEWIDTGALQSSIAGTVKHQFKRSKPTGIPSPVKQRKNNSKG